MKRIKFNRAVMVPKFGVFNIGQEYQCDDDYAVHVVESMKAAEYVKTAKEPAVKKQKD